MGSLCSVKAQPIQVKHQPMEDLLNLWGLCMSLRGCPVPRSAVIAHQWRKERLPALIENAERRIRDGLYHAARHTLEWRLLVMEVAELYMEEKKHASERRSGLVAAGHRVHKSRDVTLDWLTERLFGASRGGVSLSAQDTKGERSKAGCVSAVHYCVQESLFKAGHAGVSHTTFVNQLIRTFGDSKTSLASLSRIMESWLVDGRCPSDTLRIERLTEDDSRNMEHQTRHGSTNVIGQHLHSSSETSS
ncbi:hypothetical protein MY3296_002678 [Beauveria thailandica]